MGTESLATKIAGKIAGSDDNQSGLISVLNQYLRNGGTDTLQARARDHGLSGEFSAWGETEHPDSTSAETIRSLFTQDEIEAFSNETGQNETGVISALANQLPRVMRKKG